MKKNKVLWAKCVQLEAFTIDYGWRNILYTSDTYFVDPNLSLYKFASFKLIYSRVKRDIKVRHKIDIPSFPLQSDLIE